MRKEERIVLRIIIPIRVSLNRILSIFISKKELEKTNSLIVTEYFSPINPEKKITQPRLFQVYLWRLICRLQYLIFSKKILLIAIPAFIFSNKSLANYTISNGSTIDPATTPALLNATDTISIYGTMAINSNVTFTSATPLTVLIYGANGQIYWYTNSSLLFPAGTTITFINNPTAPPGLQPTSGAASKLFQIGDVKYASTNTNSNNVAYSFDQLNSIGGTPKVSPSTTTPVICYGSSINLLANPLVPAGSTIKINWSLSPVSGTFSDNNSSTATNTTLSGLAPNTYTDTCQLYGVTGAGNYVLVANQVITLTVNPLPTISGSLNVCSGSTIQLTGSGTPASSNPWVSASTGIATVNNSGLVTGVSVGTSTITYTNNNGCSKTAIVTVDASPSATISYSGNPYCYNSGNATITFSGTTGGTFSSSPAGASINSANGIVDLAASNPGKFTVSYSIPASSGCALYTVGTEITINPDTWIGNSNTDWSTPGNWAATYTNACPVVTVLGGIPYYPLINSGVVSIQSLVIKSGANLTVNNATFQISGSITNAGTFDVSNGTLEMNGSSAQSIAGSMFVNKSIKNLIVSNTGTGLSVDSTANDTLKITGTLSFGNINSNLNTGDNIDLVSDSGATANVGVVNPGNTITGKVIVERYIPTGINHGKGWQLLSVPTIGQTIKESWMEGGLITSTPNGYGAWITGPGGTSGGFDAASSFSSMKTYVPSTDSWVAVSNPSLTSIHNDFGYIIFVRGDRSVVNAFGANSTAIPTNLRSKGTLLTGTLPSISVPAGEYQTIGNPYASRVEFSLLTKSNVDNVIYVWDPLLYGVNGYGGYQTLSGTNNFQPIVSSSYYQLGVSYPFIESGQAFLVHNSTGASGSVTFTESAKASGSRMVNRPFSVLSQRQFFRTYLYNNAGAIVDGNAVVFDSGFSNAVDGDDAMKMANSWENFGIKRDGKILAVEARSPVTASDTVFYNLANFTRQTYRLQFAPQNMRGSGLSAYLVDKYLNTNTPVSLDDTSSIAITINTDAASFAANRLMVVFSPMAPLPVTFTSVTARQVNNEIAVEWQVENESNMKQYEVEKSLDGSSFTKVATKAAINGLSNNYQWIDQQPATGNNYYRIKSVDINGKTHYTQVVKVWIKNIGQGISIYPNPVKEGNINIHLNNEPSGTYEITLIDPIGQVILSKKIYSKGNSTEIIELNEPSANGVYQLKVLKPNGSEQLFKLLK